MSTTAEAEARLNEEQRQLRDVLGKALSRVVPREVSRKVLETSGYVDNLWTAMADLGLPGILIPEDYGGAGGTLADAVVVLEEIGKVPTANPFLASAVLASQTIVVLADDEQRSRWLPSLASGERIGTVAICGVTGLPDIENLGVSAERDGDQWRLSGHATFVPDGAIADLIILVCRAGEYVVFVAVDAGTAALTVVDTPCFDLSRRFADVRVDDLIVDSSAILGGQTIQNVEALNELVSIAAVAIAADSLGGLEHVTTMASQYARDRVQFGKPIGSFQAIKHRCADMAIAAASARVAVDAACRGGAPTRLSASIAKSFATGSYAKAAGDCLQVHGGIGFTWEHDCHLFLRRAKLNEALYGDVRWHRELIARTALARE